MCENETTEPNNHHAKAKACAALIASAALATGITLDPEHAATYGLIASIAIPFVPSAYKGIFAIASGLINAIPKRSTRKLPTIKKRP